MPLQLPNLDDRSFADLVEEARRLIPSLDGSWTNHNPSDPGITVLESFAYLSEMLLYRLDRVTDENLRRFLKLLQEPDWTASSPGDLAADVREVVRSVRARYRAVSPADYEAIALEDFGDWLAAMRRGELAGDTAALSEWFGTTGLQQGVASNLPTKVPGVRRARCVPTRNLERGTEEERTRPEAAHVSLIVVPESTAALAVEPLDPPPALLKALWGFLDERRILATRHHVVAAHHAPVSAEIVIARTPDAVEETSGGRPGLYDRVLQKLQQFLDPLAGGTDGEGWPFGRDVYVSELVEQLEDVQGVDYVTDLMLSSACGAGETFCVPAPLLWHPEGDLIGLALSQHHLPKAAFDPKTIKTQIEIAPHSSFVPVQVAVEVKAATADLVTPRRQAKVAVRKFFHPFTAAPKPGPGSSKRFLLPDLKAALAAVPLSVTSVSLGVDPARWFPDGGGGFSIQAGELINWQTTVVVTP